MPFPQIWLYDKIFGFNLKLLGQQYEMVRTLQRHMNHANGYFNNKYLYIFSNSRHVSVV